MFIGSIPDESLMQMTRAVDFTEWPAAYVCCSGSFRYERVIRKFAPAIDIHANDVSLLSCAVGRLATGQDMRLVFTNALAWIEDRIGPDATLRDRLGALLVAGSYAEHATGSRSIYKQRHIDALVGGFDQHHAAANAKVDTLISELSIQTFEARDLRDHAKAAIERGDGAGVVSFPPTYKGGYEALYKFVHANVDWDEPAYSVWDPAEDLPKLMDELDAAGVPWYLGGDFLIPGRKPVAELRPGRNKPIYGYAGEAKRQSFSVVGQPKAAPFLYKPLDPRAITADSTVEIVITDAPKAAFVKDVYLAKNIIHANGEVNLLVYLDGMLAGLIVFARARRQVYHGNEIYLLSDLSTTRDAKVSKLIAALTTCAEIVRFLERHYLRRFEYVVTTAFAKGPVSMKYRGVFDLLKREQTEDGYMLNYGRLASTDTASEVFNQWWTRHGEKAVKALG